MLVLSSEERLRCEELGDDAGQTPHVDGAGVAGSHDDFRGSVVAGLDVGVDLLLLVTA